MTVKRCATLLLILLGLQTGVIARLADPASAELTGTLTASVLMLRDGIRGAVRGRLTRGAVMTVLETRDGWDRVRLPDGRTGWLVGRYIAVGEKPVAVSLVVRPGPSPVAAQTGVTPRTATGRALRVKLTGYYPPPPGGYRSKAEARREGGGYGLKGKLRTLQAYDAKDPNDYVSCATDPRLIRTGTSFMIDGFPGVRFLACDIGGGVNGAHVDICVANKATAYRVTTRSATVRFLR